MTTNNLTGANIESLMEMLASKDGMIRQKARETLVALGEPAVSPLIEAMRNSVADQVRWEAAKALGAILDTRSIPSLVKALTDCNPDVAWLAADALRKFKKAAWPLLLGALLKSESDSGFLYQGVHHVLLNQNADGYNDLLAILMQALERGEVSESAMVAAHEILKRMKAEV